MKVVGWGLALVGVAVLTRVPFQTRWPYAWDSILYMRALQRFDVVQHQPQPPGYIFYVGLAWLLDQVWRNPNQSLVALSIFGTAWAAFCLLLLGLSLRGLRTGVLAALILMTSPTFWAYGEVAYPYTVLAALATTVALLVRWTLSSPAHLRRQRLLFTTLAYALMAGLRQDILLLLAPLYLLVLWRRPLADWILAILVGTIGTAAWLAPSAYLSGGLPHYLDAVVQQMQKVGEASSVATTGRQVLEDNLRPFLLGIWHALYLATVPAVYFLGRRAAQRRWGTDLTLLTLWIVPPTVFYLAVHIGDVGYTFSVVPALCLLAALGLDQLAADLSRRTRASNALGIALAVLLIGSNAGQFLLRPGSSPYSARGLRCHDLKIEAKIGFVRSHFPSGPTVLLGIDSYQHTSYFLPDYWSYNKLAAHRRLRDKLPTGMEWAVVMDDNLVLKGHWQKVDLPCGSSVRYRHLIKPVRILYDRPVLSLMEAEADRWKPN